MLHFHGPNAASRSHRPEQLMRRRNTIWTWLLRMKMLRPYQPSETSLLHYPRCDQIITEVIKTLLDVKWWSLWYFLKGKLLGVCGNVGSGKTSLICSILEQVCFFCMLYCFCICLHLFTLCFYYFELYITVTLVFWPAHFPFRCTFFRAPSQLMGHLRTFASRPGFFMELFEKIFLWGNLLIRPGKLNPSSCIYGCHLLLVNHHFVWIVNRGPFELHIPNLPWEAQKNQVGYLPWNF